MLKYHLPDEAYPDHPAEYYTPHPTQQSQFYYFPHDTHLLAHHCSCLWSLPPLLGLKGYEVSPLPRTVLGT